MIVSTFKHTINVHSFPFCNFLSRFRIGILPQVLKLVVSFSTVYWVCSDCMCLHHSLQWCILSNVCDKEVCKQVLPLYACLIYDWCEFANNGNIWFWSPKQDGSTSGRQHRSPDNLALHWQMWTDAGIQKLQLLKGLIRVDTRRLPTIGMPPLPPRTFPSSAAPLPQRS